MRNVLLLFSMLLFFSACNDEEVLIDEVPKRIGSYTDHNLYLTFENDKKQDLTSEINLFPANEEGTLYMTSVEDFSARFFMNGLEDNRQLGCFVIKREDGHNIFWIHAVSNVGFEKEDPLGLSEDIYYPFTYKIMCPSVFGDTEEHTITVLQRSIDIGTQNMCSVTVEDEVLVTNVKNGLKPYIIVITSK